MGAILIFSTIAYCMTAVVDVALCWSGAYTRAGVPVPTLMNIRAGVQLGLPYLAISHALMTWWLLDAGWFGKLELPGALLGFLFADAIMRLWRLHRT